MTQKNVLEFYTTHEDRLNSLTHGIGAVMSLVGMIVLLVAAVQHGDSWRVISFTIYGFSLLILYLASTLYHTSQHPRFKAWLRIADHSSIYLLIAGTYTPFLLVNLRGPFGWTMLGIVWGMAVLGVVLKVFFIGRHDVLETAVYIIMGWMALFAYKQMAAGISPGGMAWILGGGVVYTLGVIFYAWNKLPYNHAIWHLFVLGGSVCHYLAILFYVLPQ